MPVRRPDPLQTPPAPLSLTAAVRPGRWSPGSGRVRPVEAEIIRDMCLRSGDGFPDVLVVDHDPKYTSDVFRAITKGMGSTASTLIVGCPCRPRPQGAASLRGSTHGGCGRGSGRFGNLWRRRTRNGRLT
jgi:hypothetical protein